MSNRSASFLSVIVACILAGTTFSAIAQTAPKTVDTKAADTCLSAPKPGAVPAGGHWYYRIDRPTKRQCWYLGEEKNKTAKAAPAQTDSSAIAGSSPTPALQNRSMRTSIADARAELPAPQTNTIENPAVSIAQPDHGTALDSQPPAAPQAETQSSAISSRWLDSSSTTPSPTPQLAVADLQANAASASHLPVSNTAAPMDSSLDKQSPSTQVLLMIIAGAVALAGLFSAAIMRFGRMSAPSYDVRDQRHTPWDSIPWDSLQTERLSPARWREAPRRRPAHSLDPRASDDPDRRVAEMLARLARSAQT